MHSQPHTNPSTPARSNQRGGLSFSQRPWRTEKSLNYTDNQLLTEKQAAAEIGFEPQTLAAWRTGRGQPGPAFQKLGRSVRYRYGTLREWVEGKTYPNTVAARSESRAR